MSDEKNNQNWYSISIVDVDGKWVDITEQYERLMNYEVNLEVRSAQIEKGILEKYDEYTTKPTNIS